MADAQKTFPCKAPTVQAVAFSIDPNRAPWERQVGETQKQFAAFVAYRDLGLGTRSIPAAAKAVGLSPRSGQVARWSMRNQWPARARAWDVELERKKQVALVEEIQKMVRRHVAVSQSYIAALMEPA